MEKPGGVKIVSIANEKNASLQDIFKEACEIWDECREKHKSLMKVNPKSKEQIYLTEQEYKILEDYLADVQRRHREFAAAYPTVLRHMVQELRFNRGVFLKYLKLVEKNPWTTHEERIESYTTYAYLLACEMGKKNKTSVKELQQFRQDYRDRLLKEHKDFEANVKKITEEEKKKEEDIQSRRAKNAMSAFLRLAHENNIPEDKTQSILNKNLSIDQMEKIVGNMFLLKSRDISLDKLINEKAKD